MPASLLGTVCPLPVCPSPRAKLGALGVTGDCFSPWWVPPVLHYLLFAFTVSMCTEGCCEGRVFVRDWLSKGAPGHAERVCLGTLLKSGGVSEGGLEMCIFAEALN